MEKLFILEQMRDNKNIVTYPIGKNGIDVDLTLEKMGATIFKNLSSDLKVPNSSAFIMDYYKETEELIVPQFEKSFELLQPKRLAGAINIPNAYLYDITQETELWINKYIAKFIDDLTFAAAFKGDGITEPNGLINTITTNVNSTVSQPTLDIITDLELSVKNNNTNEKLHYVSDPSLFRTSKIIPKAAGTGRFLCESNFMNGFEYKTSALLPTYDTGTSHPLFLGDFSQMIIGFFDDIEILIDPASLASQGMTRLIVTIFNDIKITDEKSFAMANKLTI